MDSHRLARSLAQRCAPRRSGADELLLHAAASLNPERAMEALGQGADPDARNGQNSTPLMVLLEHHGAPCPSIERLMEILLPISNLRAQDEQGRDPLQVAAANRWPVGAWALPMLLDAGACPLWRGRGGLDALGHACSRGSRDSVVLLLPLSALKAPHRKRPDPAALARAHGRHEAAALVEAERERRALDASCAAPPPAARARL